MNCQEVMELIQRHVDHDLNEQETSLMMNHAGHCPDCAAMLERLVNLSRGLDQLPRVVPPYSLVDAILPELGKWDAAAAETGESASLTPRGRRAERTRRTWIARVSGVVALGVVVGLLLVNGPFSGRMGTSQQDAASMPDAAANKNATSLSAAGSNDMMDQAASAKPSAEFAPQETVQPFENKGLSAAAPKSEPSSGKSDAAGGTQRSGEASGSPAAEADEAVPASPGNAKGLTVNPSNSATEPLVTMKEVKPVTEEAVSPDGQWKAVLTDGALQVFRTSDGSLVYDQAPDLGKRSGLVWNVDGTALDYEFTDADGKKSRLFLQVPDMKELAR
jgi:hypothetical protein